MTRENRGWSTMTVPTMTAPPFDGAAPRDGMLLDIGVYDSVEERMLPVGHPVKSSLSPKKAVALLVLFKLGLQSMRTLDMLDFSLNS